MNKNVLIIGGTRFFGKLLVQRLLDAGHRVTIATRGQAADSFGINVQRIKVDRKDEAAMRNAFAGIAGYDLVYDQVCYTPLDAAISVKTFKGKVGRYVMSSTIEAYNHLQGKLDRPFREDDLGVDQLTVDMDYPWYAPELAEQRYGLGKRQAEAYFYQDGSLPVVSVRIAHVLAGPQDFTGRLAAYVQQVARGKTLRHSARLGNSSFTNTDAICDFLCWVGGASFRGPINSACDGALTALDIYQRVGILMDRVITTLPVAGSTTASALSPFDYPCTYTMDTGRAKTLGYRFSHSREWLDDLILQHVVAASQAA